MTLRLVRYLARCGVASRRAAADLVRDGLVAVNGALTTNVAMGIGETDRVTVRGKTICLPKETVVLLMNKPAGAVCSLKDPHNPRTVLDYLPPPLREKGLKPVGRLDKETTGLLLLTNDGSLAYRLTHPRYGVSKVYRALLEGRISQASLAKLRRGVELDDGPTSPAQTHVVSRPEGRSVIELTIHEGRKRQVRRMFESVGHRVVRLERTRLGPLSLGSLGQGQARRLDPREVAQLRRCVGLSEAGD